MGIQSAFVKGLQPPLQREILLPGVKLCAFTPCGLQHFAHSPVAPSQHSLQKAGVRVVPVIGNGLGGDGLPQQLHPPLVFLLGDLRFPLKRRVGLGHKPRGGHGDSDAPLLVGSALPPRVHDAGSQIRNAQHILVRFRGQAQHKIQLHGVIAACKSRAAGCQQLLLGHIFIDNVPQALSAGLRRKGQTGLAPLGQPLHKAHGKIIRPQAGERQIHMALLAKLLQIVA